MQVSEAHAKRWFFEERIRINAEFLKTRFSNSFDWLQDDDPFVTKISTSILVCLEAIHLYHT